MTFFGQFFDHGLDLISKGGAGTIYIPLQPDDPLYQVGGNANFMVVTRSTTFTNEDGQQTQRNVTTPWVDQNQTYTSHPSHQVFLREYALVDGRPMRSCLMFAVSAVDAEITTVEGLTEADDTLSPVQQAFSDCHGLQCGFCTPGFLTTITAGLKDNPDPTEDEAREMIAGNLCRCTGYQNIVRAVMSAASDMRGEGPLPGSFRDAADDDAKTGASA